MVYAHMNLLRRTRFVINHSEISYISRNFIWSDLQIISVWKLHAILIVYGDYDNDINVEHHNLYHSWTYVTKNPLWWGKFSIVTVTFWKSYWGVSKLNLVSPKKTYLETRYQRSQYEIMVSWLDFDMCRSLWNVIWHLKFYLIWCSSRIYLRLHLYCPLSHFKIQL